MSFECLLYFIGVIDGVKDFIQVCACVSLISIIIAAICYAVTFSDREEEDILKCRKFLKWSTICFCYFCLVNSLKVKSLDSRVAKAMHGEMPKSPY